MSTKDLQDRKAKLKKLGSLKELGNKVSNRAKQKEKPESDQTDVYRRIPLSQIISKVQVRKKFTGIRELADSIQSGGLEQPIHVLQKDDDGNYVIAKGERRFRAVKLLDWDDIPAIIQDAYDSEASRIISQLAENIQRDNLMPHETAEALVELKNGGMNGKETAKRLGVSEPFVSKHIAFFHKSPRYILALSEDGIIKSIDALNFLRQLHDIAPDRAKLLADKAVNQGEMTRSEVKKVFTMVKEELDSKQSGSDTGEDTNNDVEENNYEKINSIKVDPRSEKYTGGEGENAEANEVNESDSNMDNAESPTTDSNVPDRGFDIDAQSKECFPGSGVVTRVNVITSGKKRSGVLLLGLTEGSSDHVWVQLDSHETPERVRVSQINLVSIERVIENVE